MSSAVPRDATALTESVTESYRLRDPVSRIDPGQLRETITDTPEWGL
ncbi:protein of unknown function [Microbacterium sp. Nx66]|nr:protein of unknown function [Microbacterium sp. Nx66]